MAYKKFELEPIKRKQISEAPLAIGGFVFPRLNVIYVPEKFVRKPPKKGVPDWVPEPPKPKKEMSVRQIRSGHIKFLWNSGWTFKQIMKKMSVDYYCVRNNVLGRVCKHIEPIKPDWFDQQKEVDKA